jgi:hypothetical protein
MKHMLSFNVTLKAKRPFRSQINYKMTDREDWTTRIGQKRGRVRATLMFSLGNVEDAGFCFNRFSEAVLDHFFAFNATFGGHRNEFPTMCA